MADTVDDNKPDDPVGVHTRFKNVENDGPRDPGTVVTHVVVHADASKKASSTVNWIEDDGSDVSYHSFTERDGDLHRFVEPWRRAWACGKSSIGGRSDVNDFSLSISLSNRNDSKEPYTELEYQVAAAEVASWFRLNGTTLHGVRFDLSLDRITTHAIISPGRKTDPGPQFDMVKFRHYVQQTLVGVIAS